MNQNFNRLFIVVALMSLTASASAQTCQNKANGSCPSTSSTLVSVSAHHNEMDIVDTAVKAGSFKTLAAALKAADLVDALKGEGPFTVFAPTDEAFAKLPEGVVADLLKPENKAKLQAVLTYHVVSGKIMAGDVLKAMEVTTLQGSMAPVGLTIGGANVIKTDIKCSNGVIHVIDSVILPPAK
jgi:transforming growth factor-beta-induced protein